MPANMDFALYFNILFFAAIGLGFLIGYIRGFKKSLYALIIMLLFYGVFFVTLDAVINQVWVAPIPFAFSYAAPYVPELASVTTIGEAVFVMLEKFIPADYTAALDNAQLTLFITGIAQFVLKLVYMLLYFTIFAIIYRFLMYIIRVIFFTKSAKKKNKTKRLNKHIMS